MDAYLTNTKYMYKESTYYFDNFNPTFLINMLVSQLMAIRCMTILVQYSDSLLIVMYYTKS